MTNASPILSSAVGPSLSTAGRYLILVVAFFGWLFAGVHMSITQLAGQAAAIDLLDRTGELDAAQFKALNEQEKERLKARRKESSLSAGDKAQLTEWSSKVARWFSWNQCAFLFGAATGGLVFGWLGDRIGRSKAMAASIITYSAFAAAASFAESPVQFWLLWYLACTGVGGMWPNGVALVSEAWSGMSRPAVAGLIGTSANIGIFLMATLDRDLAERYGLGIRSDNWRWAFQVAALPLALGIFALFAVPESPRWLAASNAPPQAAAPSGVFQTPLLQITLLAIVLATIPMIGGWGTANWMNPWSETVGSTALKAQVLQTRALTGLVGSFLGGWIASIAGRRWTYFAVSALSLGMAQYIFWFLLPTDDAFLVWVGMLGFVSGVYFGWLPLCLPEMFPTRQRATGAGVGFNFGRIITAITLFIAGSVTAFFEGDYARIGRLTSLLFILGMVCIWFTPNTSKKELED